ncbi:MAG TPA: hypothetical protein PLP75_01230 [Burkholderiales bacterium]|nr:hypothetical protein [Burkholderiales bacterium]
MQFKKLWLISSYLLFLINTSYAACNGTTSCFDDAINYSKNNQSYSASNINNNSIESAVGSTRVFDAQNTQNSITNTLGQNYKNIDGMNQSGKNKAQQCAGKNTPDCDSFNFYNDPLTRKAQEGIVDTVGVASDLINKKIKQDVNITDYCARNPQDTVCKMCQKDPNQAMCQNGNKCTTITYKAGSGQKQTNSCSITGERNYTCNKWVDDIKFHTATYQCDPTNGGCNNYINNSLCQQTAPYIAPSCVTWEYSIAYGCTNWGRASCSSGGTYTYPGTCGKIGGSAQCDGVTKNGNDPSGGGSYNCYGLGCAGKDWVCTKSQGQLAQYSCKVIDNVIWKDNCNS